MSGVAQARGSGGWGEMIQYLACLGRVPVKYRSSRVIKVGAGR